MCGDDLSGAPAPGFIRLATTAVHRASVWDACSLAREKEAGDAWFSASASSTEASRRRVWV